MPGCQVLNPAHPGNFKFAGSGKMRWTGNVLKTEPLLKIFPTGFLEEAFFVSQKH